MEKKKQIKLLDCTLRDGGYINDWRFGRENLISIFERLVDAGVDIIEVGFLDDRRPFDLERSIMPDSESAGRIYAGLDKKDAMVVGMIDYGTCDISCLQPAQESFLDGIRVIFKKHLMKEALDYCAKVKALGYKVFAQLVSVTSYTDEELLKLVDLVNGVKPYAVSMVDTYGLLHPADLLHIHEILDRHVDLEVGIGFHAHNNFQLAYANAIAFLEAPTRPAREIVVDGTLYGMGKSAGNAPLELLAMYLNDHHSKAYAINPMLEAIQESHMEIFEKKPWGYKTFFYMCALHRCHPNYLTYFENKENLSPSKINKLLSRIEPEEKKLLYDGAVAEAIYEAYLAGEGSDVEAQAAFGRLIEGRKLLLIGPGKNIELQAAKVERFVKEEKPYRIAINYIPKDIEIDCVFVTNAKRYHDMTLALKQTEEDEGAHPAGAQSEAATYAVPHPAGVNAGRKLTLLATCNVEKRGGTFDYVINRAPLLETKEKIKDNSFLMLLKFLRGIDVPAVACAGFDGYSDKEDNYCNPAMEYHFIKQEALHLNDHIKGKIAQLREKMDIQFITYSAYDVEEDINSAAF